MSARILEMRSGSRPPGGGVDDEIIGRRPRSFSTWRGLSGRDYRHAVFSLVGCPALSEANFLLTRRTEHGDLEVLHVDRVDDSASSTNLAYVRRLGATLGASEVHVHHLPGSSADRARVELDIRSNLATYEVDRRPASTLEHTS